MSRTKTTKTMSLDSAEILTAAIAQSGKNKAAFARAAGMDRRNFYQYLRPDGSSMSAVTLTRVLEANGIKPRVTFDPM